VITPAVVILPIFPVVSLPPPNSVNQRLPSGPAVIPAGSASEVPNSVIVPTEGAGEGDGLGEAVGAPDGRGDAVGEGDGLGEAVGGPVDARAVGVGVGVGALPPPRIGATGVPLLPLHPQKIPRSRKGSTPARVIVSVARNPSLPCRQGAAEIRPLSA